MSAINYIYLSETIPDFQKNTGNDQENLTLLNLK